MIKERIGESWYNVLKDHGIDDILKDIAKWLDHERKLVNVLPPASSDLTFKAFRLTPYDKVKVVVLGQDPYHTSGVFNGVAFGNGFPDNPAKKIQPSLLNIKKELARTYGAGINIDWSLYSWAEQGVLLLNTAHTVVEREPDTHTELWEPFTHTVFAALNEKDGVVWMLWGKRAQKYKELVTNPTHKICEAGHPSPLNRTNPFVGSGCFERVNNALKEPINWVL